jgi:hypothetical protein
MNLAFECHLSYVLFFHTVTKCIEKTSKTTRESEIYDSSNGQYEDDGRPSGSSAV